jgi:hypothetical protein
VLELPVSTGGQPAEESDVGDVDGVLAVDPDESERYKQGRDLADGPDLDERCAPAQTDFSFPAPGFQEVHIIRIEYAVLPAREGTRIRRGTIPAL